MKTLLPYFFIFLSTGVYAQGFISDGSFENNTNTFLDDCTTGIHSKSNHWEGYGTCELHKVGTCATINRPIFILNDNDTIWTIDYWGYQLPKEGNHFAAIRLMHDEVDEWHEFIYTPLSKTFEKDSLYKVSFYVSVAESEEYISNDFGIAFHNSNIPSELREVDSYDDFRPRPTFFYGLDYMMYQNDTILQEYEDWVLIEFMYKAKGNEQYLIIGNFKNDANTVTKRVRHIEDDWCPSCSPSSRIFIDAVGIDSCQISDFKFEKDSILLCQDETYTIDLRDYNQDFRWNDTSTSKLRNFDSTGLYSVTYTDGNCSVKDSFYLYKFENIDDIETQIICSNNDFPLEIPIDYDFHINNRFLLNDNEISSIILNNQGAYTFEVVNEHCKSSTSFSVITAENNLDIYPNPFKDFLNISQEKEIITFVHVFNIIGQYQGKFEVRNNLLDLSILPSGVYILSFGEYCINKKLVVKQ